MTNRREFLARGSAAGVAAVALARSNPTMAVGSQRNARHQRREISSPIKGAVLRDDTILRLGGDAGGLNMTWTADDRQLVVAGDGCGWPESDQKHYCNTRLFTMSGGPSGATFEHVATYPDAPLWDYMEGLLLIKHGKLDEVKRSGPGYYGMNILAVGEHIYQFLSTENRLHNNEITGALGEGIPFNCAKLIYSPDGGRTWCNQDGSTPVVHESQAQQSRTNMVFFKEPQNAFSEVCFLQMGKAYHDNLDGYVYVYSTTGSPDGTVNLAMFRVSKTQVLDRRAYEYFAGLDVEGNALWKEDISARGVVHRFPKGWNVGSVVYNAPLDVYMMAACRSAIDGYERLQDPPGSLSLYQAAHPWGPWTVFHEDVAWTPARDTSSLAESPQIAPKWIAPDGKSFWLVWDDYVTTSGMAVTTVKGKAAADAICYPTNKDDFQRARFLWHQYYPYFGFNTQRVDLIV